MAEYGTMISHVEIILRLFLAALLGGLIGLERERASWFAGLRTHMLVCMGSTLIMIVSQYGFEGVLHKELVILDPSRVAAQVVSGIGFLGAGTILFWKNMIRGLTTAASLWVVAAVGLSIGGGLYLAAVGTTVMILLILAGIKPLEKAFLKKQFAKEIKFWSKPKVSLIALEEILNRLNLRLDLILFQMEMEDDKQIIHLFFKKIPDTNLLEVVNEIQKLSGIQKIEVSE